MCSIPLFTDEDDPYLTPKENIVEWTLYFDGLCEPANPGGRIAWGWVIERPGHEPVTGGGAIDPCPENTNNEAEYRALLECLRAAAELATTAPSRPDVMFVKGDSQLVIKQMDGTWLCRNARMHAMQRRCYDTIDTIGAPTRFDWVGRDHNAKADSESRRAYHAATRAAQQEKQHVQ
jgi:ribonuclease HI